MNALALAAQQSQLKATELLSRPISLALTLFVITAIGFFNALPHANEPIWQDEAATLMFHASRGVIQPFVHYLSPNNHIGFSSMMAAWMQLFPKGLDVFTLRTLPLLLFLGAIPATFFAALRIGGPLCAILASTMFASSTLSGNFSTQLRGYGPSWIFLALMFLCAMNVQSKRHVTAWRLGFFASCLLSIALLPTNFFFALALSVATIPMLASGKARTWFDTIRPSIPLLAAPPICLLLAYGLVWNELMSFSSVNLSGWSRSALLQNWLIGSLSGYVWLLPLAGAGLLVGLRQLFQNPLLPDGKLRSKTFMTSVLLIVAFLVAVLAIPNIPFPRTLVPYFPIWVCAIAYLATYGVREIIHGTSPALFMAGLALSGLPLVIGSGLPSCKAERLDAGAYDYDLCYQYFRDSYHPGKVLDNWASLGRDDVPIVTNYEGFYALTVLGSNAKIFEANHYKMTEGPLPLLVVHDTPQLESIALGLGANPRDYQLFADTGYFIVYAPKQPR